MEKIYKEIQQYIEKVDFNALWKGFVPYEFALYNDEKVRFETYEIPVTNQFIGNTSINYNGRQIAIWKLEENDTKDIAILAASIIHEMYHVHQMTFGENRFISDLLGLTYPLEYKSLNLKVSEMFFLSRAIIEANQSKKEAYFQKFLAVRSKRFELIGDACAYEKSIETIVGTAEYVALKSLKTINLDAYEKQMDKAIGFITTLNENFLDVRRMAYYSGALIYILADELSIDYKVEMAPNLKYNMDMILDRYKPKADIALDMEENPIIQTLIDERQKKVGDLVKAIVENDQVDIKEGQFTTKGYDPMNMKRIGSYVYHKHFLGIEQDGKIEFVRGPIVTETDGKDFSKFSKYYKINVE